MKAMYINVVTSSKKCVLVYRASDLTDVSIIRKMQNVQIVSLRLVCIL